MKQKKMFTSKTLSSEAQLTLNVCGVCFCDILLVLESGRHGHQKTAKPFGDFFPNLFWDFLQPAKSNEQNTLDLLQKMKD